MPSASLKEKITNKWSNEKVLELLNVVFNTRAQAGVKFIVDEDNLIHGYNIVFVAGDKLLPSADVEFEWPLQPMPMPEALKGTLH